jgi:hypothetical protein
MSLRLPGPEREKLLKARIKCIRSAERRITHGKKLYSHTQANPEAYRLALQYLREKRSQYAAELRGIPWQADLFKPPSRLKPPRLVG